MHWCHLPPPQSTCAAFPNGTSLGTPLPFISSGCWVQVLCALLVLFSLAGYGQGHVLGSLGASAVRGAGGSSLCHPSPCTGLTTGAGRVLGAGVAFGGVPVLSP